MEQSYTEETPSGMAALLAKYGMGSDQGAAITQIAAGGGDGARIEEAQRAAEPIAEMIASAMQVDPSNVDLQVKLSAATFRLNAAIASGNTSAVHGLAAIVQALVTEAANPSAGTLAHLTREEQIKLQWQLIEKQEQELFEKMAQLHAEGKITDAQFAAFTSASDAARQYRKDHPDFMWDLKQQAEAADLTRRAGEAAIAADPTGALGVRDKAKEMVDSVDAIDSVGRAGRRDPFATAQPSPGAAANDVSLADINDLAPPTQARSPERGKQPGQGLGG